MSVKLGSGNYNQYWVSFSGGMGEHRAHPKTPPPFGSCPPPSYYHIGLPLHLRYIFRVSVCVGHKKIKTRLISIVSKPIEFHFLVDEYLVQNCFKEKGFFGQNFLF